MDRLTRWVIDMLRVQEDEERRKRRDWAKLDQLLSDALEKPFTPYSTTREAMSLLIADMADYGWKWSGIGLDNMAYGTAGFFGRRGKRRVVRRRHLLPCHSSSCREGPWHSRQRLDQN